VRFNYSTIIVICLFAAGVNNVAARPALLEPFTWENRLLLIFAPRHDDPRLQRQNDILDDLKPGLVDRDLVVIRLTPVTAVTVDRVPVADATPAYFYHEFAVSYYAFAVLLIGKDGSVKLTAAAPVEAASVFDLIDAMPMRQWEMQNKGAFNNQD